MHFKINYVKYLIIILNNPRCLSDRQQFYHGASLIDQVRNQTLSLLSMIKKNNLVFED